jgi:hypothetical protein
MDLALFYRQGDILQCGHPRELLRNIVHHNRTAGLAPRVRPGANSVLVRYQTY